MLIGLQGSSTAATEFRNMQKQRWFRYVLCLDPQQLCVSLPSSDVRLQVLQLLYIEQVFF